MTRLCDDLPATPASLKPRAAIVAEPTEMRVVVATKGVVRWEIVFHGRAAHSSKPHLGINAISHAAEAFRMNEGTLFGLQPVDQFVAGNRIDTSIFVVVSRAIFGMIGHKYYPFLKTVVSIYRSGRCYSSTEANEIRAKGGLGNFCLVPKSSLVGLNISGLSRPI